MLYIIEIIIFYYIFALENANQVHFRLIFQYYAAYKGINNIQIEANIWKYFLENLYTLYETD